MPGPRSTSGVDVRLSARTEHLRQASVLRTLTERVSGFPDGINLGQGVCDLDMPPVLADAAVRSIRTSRATYTPYAGVEPLRRRIAERMARRHGLDYDADEIVVTVGASAALSSTFFTLLDPGDEVVLLEPFYPYHRSAALLAGARVRAVPAAAPPARLDWAGLEAALGPRSRLLVLNTPANPGGFVWSRADLDRLAALLAPTDVSVVTDEIYEDLVYDGRAHLPPAAIPALADRTITISGLSKSYSVTGWRLGWLAAPREIAAAIGPVFDTLCVCAPRPLQEAAAEALRVLPESYYGDLRAAYERRRDHLARALRGGGLEPRIPDGAYYMLADYRDRFGEIPSREASLRLLDETRIAAIPGEIFHAETDPTVLRFHFAAEEPVLDEVARRLSRPRI